MVYSVKHVVSRHTLIHPYTKIHTGTHIYPYKNSKTRIHVHPHKHTGNQTKNFSTLTETPITNTDIYRHIYTHTHILTYSHRHIHAYTHTHIHSYTHSYIHTYTHT